VCADCHSTIKYISKSTGREIILRDFFFFERSSNCWLSDFIAEGKLYIEHPYTKACDEVNRKNQRKG
jgi:hypothetical protein